MACNTLGHQLDTIAAHVYDIASWGMRYGGPPVLLHGETANQGQPIGLYLM